MDNKIKHLEMIQGVINRMANNSFLLKGWSVVLISALFALAAKDAHIYFVYLAYFPAVAFWVLDAYYLWQERLFRKLYDKVRGLNESDIDFSMSTSAVQSEVSRWYKVARSTTMIIFHGVIIATIFIVMIMMLLTSGPKGG